MGPEGLADLTSEKQSFFASLFRKKDESRLPTTWGGVTGAEEPDAPDEDSEDWQDDDSHGFSTWAPVEGTPGITRFTFQNRDAGLRKADYNDPTLSSGFDGATRDRENFIGRRLLEQYKEAPSPDKLENLMAHYEQVLAVDISKYAGQKLPEPAVRGRVYNAFKHAVDTYDMQRDTEGGKPMALHNFYQQSVSGPKVARWASSHKGFAHIPYERAAKHDQVRTALQDFELDSGREPSAQELVSLTNGITLAEMQRILPELKSTGTSSRNIRQDYIVDESAAWRSAVHRVRDVMPEGPKRQLYEEYFAPIFGLPDSRMRKGQLAAKYGMSGSQLSKLFAEWKNQINREMALVERDL
jgi:hypothetical protein